MKSQRKIITKTKSCEGRGHEKNESESKQLQTYEDDNSFNIPVRLKRSKLVSGDNSACKQCLRPVAKSLDMFIDSQSILLSSDCNSELAGTSNVSVNFSQYDLNRNLSLSDCRSDGAHSSTTCGSNINPVELSLRHEQLEKYFRSIENWSGKDTMSASQL